MKLKTEERVEQVIRHLQPSEAMKIARALTMLQDGGIEQFKGNLKLYKLGTGEQLYVFRATPRLRILMKRLDENTVLIEDIVSHDVLEKFMRQRKR